jgi:probable F420-dependent oxidoreductase
MRIGLSIFPTASTVSPLELARVAEECGFESLWFPEHSHIPTSRSTPWGGRRDAEPLPSYYWETYDQMVTLGAVAAATSTLRIGTGVSLVAQHDHLWLAKQVATLDTLSGGRVLFGIGYGWNKEELRHHGVRYTERRAVLREKILAMKALWTEEEASFTGEHITLEPSWAWPKPVQQPHPPILMGGSAGPRTIADIVEFCDGWMPIVGRSELESGIEQLRRAAEDAGRDPEGIEIGAWGTKPRREVIEQFEAAGVSRMIISLRQGSRDEVLAKVDEHASLVAEFLE